MLPVVDRRTDECLLWPTPIFLASHPELGDYRAAGC